MERKVYIQNDIVCLSEYIKSEDDIDCYNCWLDTETQNGYNFIMTEAFEQYTNSERKLRFIATIIRQSDNACVGSIFVSPENSLPDLAIMMYKTYRNKGYGTAAFLLGVKYCFNVLKLDKIYAGCYIDNQSSLAMLKKCGFQIHPEGNQNEKHYLTAKDTTQLDFVKYNDNFMS